MKTFLLCLLIIFSFVFESVFVQLLPETINSSRLVVPHFLLVILILLTIYGKRNTGIMYSFIFGLLFDIVYTEILGIYLFMLPVVSYICSKLMKILQTNLVIVVFVTAIGVALLEFGVYEITYIIHRTDMDFISFLRVRLLPTLVLNIIFTILFCYPLKRYFEKYGDEIRND